MKFLETCEFQFHEIEILLPVIILIQYEKVHNIIHVMIFYGKLFISWLKSRLFQNLYFYNT